MRLISFLSALLLLSSCSSAGYDKSQNLPSPKKDYSIILNTKLPKSTISGVISFELKNIRRNEVKKLGIIESGTDISIGWIDDYSVVVSYKEIEISEFFNFAYFGIEDNEHIKIYLCDKAHSVCDFKESDKNLIISKFPG